MPTTTERRTLTPKQEIYEALKRDILSGSLPPGQPLVERDLVTRFRASRTPIREVLRLLERERLVEVYPNRGVFVRKLTLKDVNDIFEMRLAIEPTAARLAADRYDIHELDRIKKAFLNAPVEDDPKALQRLVALGKDLHDFIAFSTNNALIIETSNQLHSLMVLIRNMTKHYFNIERRSYSAHLRIIDALQQRDPARSEQTMRDHLLETWKGILELHFRAG
jgi:DNA-binding GntR family transcriptional regulator